MKKNVFSTGFFCCCRNEVALELEKMETHEHEHEFYG
jgi:hypothetical protein